MSKEAFIRVVTADQPEAPPYFTYDAVLNSQERPTLDQALAREMKPLTLDAVLAMRTEGEQSGVQTGVQAGVQIGVQILDTRDPEEFGAAHLAGSINVGLGGQYATWAGTVLDHTHPIVIIATPGRENESAIRLGRIGFDHIAGYLENGLESLASRPELIASTERVSAPFAAELLSSPQPPLAIDVRAPREHEQKHIEGSLALPLNRLLDSVKTLPKDRRLLIYCAGGYRSSIAASLLQANGFASVAEITGGFTAWETANLPVVAPPAGALQ
jgi:rhodanese-related sulfurtransferase